MGVPSGNGSGNGLAPAKATRLRDEGDRLRRLIAFLHRRAVPIVASVLVVSIAAVTLSLLQDKQYSATASLLFREQSVGQELPGGPAVKVDPQTEAQTNLQLGTARRVAALTAERLGPSFDAGEIADSVEVTPKGSTNLGDVTVTWPSAREAALVATEFARRLKRFEADAERSRIAVAQRRLRTTIARELESDAPDLARIAAMRQRVDDLEVLKNVSSGQMQLVSEAEVPSGPSSPNPERNALIGIGIGLLLGLAIAIFLEMLDRRVRRSEDFEELLGVPVLAQIPASDGFMSTVRSPFLEPPVEVEFFNLLCSTIQRLGHGSRVKSVLITSPTPEVGKTMVAMNLALAAARGGADTLLLEVDLRRPRVAERLGLDWEPNLAQALNGDLPLREVVQSVPVFSPAFDEQDAAVLDVVVAGDPTRDAPRLAESAEMERIVEEAESIYDLVIVDVPPTALISDAVALLSLVDATLVVCRFNHTTRDEALWLRSQLAQLRARVLGVVSNFAPVKVDDYYGSYRWQFTPDRTPVGNGSERART